MASTTSIIVGVIAFLVVIGVIIGLILTHSYGASPNGSLAFSENECSGNSGGSGSGSL
jgi:F0F1-type ATP synthase assembly protein I